MKQLTNHIYLFLACIAGAALILSIPTYTLFGGLAAESIMTVGALAIGLLFTFSVFWLWRLGAQNNLRLLVVLFAIIGIASAVIYYFFELDLALIGVYVAGSGIVGSFLLKNTKKLTIQA